MDKIRTHLWYDTQAVEAAELYTATFPESRILDVGAIHDTPSGDVDIVSFELFGNPFMAISAGPHFKFNPSISLLVRCESEEEVDNYWATLSVGGETLMPLDAYDFSAHYGWTTDRYGLSWQIMLADERMAGARLTPMLMFVGAVCGKAEEAARYYASVFPDSGLQDVDRYGADDAPDREGTARHVRFVINGQEFAAMDSAHGHDFAFNEAISFQVNCDSQEEIDRYWERLSAVPEAEQCGWLKDAFGVSWQVVPTAMNEMLRDGTQDEVARVTQAFLPMKKFDLAALQRAYEGA